MSITALVGLPGSGKSYGAVRHHIIPALEQGRTVVTNIPLQLDKVKERYPSATVRLFTWDEMKKGGGAWWDELPPGAVYVMDELWHWLPAGILSKDIPENEREFLAMHRHKVGADGYATEIVFLAQDLSQIAKFPRNLVEKTYQMIKLNAVGMDNRYSVHVYQGSVEGQKPPKGRLISTYHGKYDPDVYSLYTSHTLSETGLAGTEKALDKRGVVWKSPAFKYGAIFIVLGVTWAVWHLVGVVSSFGQDSPETPPPATVPGISSAVASVPPTPPSIEAPPPAPISYSATWRLSGTYQIGAAGRALLQSTDGQVRTVLLSESCAFDGRDWECKLGNEVVSRWTGKAKQPDMLEGGFEIAGNSVKAAMR